jgi:hypothetical protein
MDAAVPEQQQARNPKAVGDAKAAAKSFKRQECSESRQHALYAGVAVKPSATPAKPAMAKA